MGCPVCEGRNLGWEARRDSGPGHRAGDLAEAVAEWVGFV